MGLFHNIWDGLLRPIAAMITVFVFGPPIWASHQVITYGIVPVWFYIGPAGLIFVGGNRALAFRRKTLDGVAPLRARRRR